MSNPIWKVEDYEHILERSTADRKAQMHQCDSAPLTIVTRACPMSDVRPCAVLAKQKRLLSGLCSVWQQRELLTFATQVYVVEPSEADIVANQLIWTVLLGTIGGLIGMCCLGYTAYRFLSEAQSSGELLPIIPFVQTAKSAEDHKDTPAGTYNGVSSAEIPVTGLL